MTVAGPQRTARFTRLARSYLIHAGELKWEFINPDIFGSMTRCVEEILLAREHYFPATIADMYDPERMDQEFPLVREAHERNDEVLERIYIGRRFKNDTERLEKLFDMYTKMTAAKPAAIRKTARIRGKTAS